MRFYGKYGECTMGLDYKQVVFQDGNFKKATEWYMVPLNDIESKINEVIAGLQK